ncbi:MAG: hypothetical protein NT062_25865, partial [Proteobacteria bacterium]|nr:hypothetical protein [Pseudomonadota bacterium]
VELCRPEHVVFAGLPIDDAMRLVIAVARLFGSPAVRDAANIAVDDPDIQRAHDELVRSALSVKLRARLEAVLAAIANPGVVIEVGGHIATSQRVADRAALLVGGDPVTIVAAARARGDSLAHLISAIAQPGWLALRAKLGVGASR